MSFFTEPSAALAALRSVLGADVQHGELPAAAAALADEALERLVVDATVLVQAGEALRIAAAGVVAARSTREIGHGGMAQVRGHRTAVSLIQDLTGTTKADATKQVRLGQALLEAATTPAGSCDTGALKDFDADAETAQGHDAARRPWHAVLGDCLLEGRLTKDQHDVILRGLGESPTGNGTTAEDDGGSASESADAQAWRAAWAVAAEQLASEVEERTVEDLNQAARSVRDLLDPVGAADRFDRRFAERSFRRWTDPDGGKHARIDFDDEMAAWVDSVIDTALRPRRGGPRFVDADEAARAKQFETDDRTNDQLTSDLMMDVIRAGALADEKVVFGTRQAGVRIVVTEDTIAADRAAVAVLEDDSATLPAWLASQHACDTGTTSCTVDRHGNPLYLGREERLFTPKQKLALAIRDGGCRWHDCDRPTSYCESHHIDHFGAGGATDVDRGILLCRYHHMALHRGGWRITRHGLGDFVLHPPPGRADLSVLAPRLARRYAFGDLKPPPTRFRPAA